MLYHLVPLSEEFGGGRYFWYFHFCIRANINKEVIAFFCYVLRIIKNSTTSLPRREPCSGGRAAELCNTFSFGWVPGKLNIQVNISWNCWFVMQLVSSVCLEAIHSYFYQSKKINKNYAWHFFNIINQRGSERGVTSNNLAISQINVFLLVII